MSATSEQSVERARKRVIRDYKRRGYRVTDHPTPDLVPGFLRDFHPGLMVERADDHAVVEVRTAQSLKGANEFVELAERIESTEGWRLELVTVRPEEPSTDLSYATKAFRALCEQPITAHGSDVWTVYFISLIEELVTELARTQGIRPRDKSVEFYVRELAFRAVIDDDTEADIMNALGLRKRVLLSPNQMRQTAPDVAKDLGKLCELLFAMLSSARSDRTNHRGAIKNTGFA